MINALGVEPEQADLTTLVLTAALGPQELAPPAWKRATGLESIDIWPNELARPLPRIFLRLRSDTHTPHLSLLRGIFRAAWAANMLRVRQCLPVLADLTESGIPYRLIKGTAVCSLTQEWGARRMGDVDLVVADSKQVTIREILARRGFAERVPYSFPSGLWDDGHGGIIDLHWARSSDSYLGTILAGPSRSIDLFDSRATVPSPEFSVAIAARHARDGIAASDFIQGLMDLDRLLPQCEISKLKHALTAFDVWPFTESMLEQLHSLGNQSAAALPPLGPPPPAGTQPKGRLQGRINRIKYAVRVARRRTQNPITLARSTPHLARAPFYFAWLAGAQFRPIEHFAARRFDGFLPTPAKFLPPHTVVSVRPTTELTQGSQLSAIRVNGIEDRWKIRVAPSRRLRIRLAADDHTKMLARMVFVNGTLHGFFPADGRNSTVLDVVDAGETLEFSLRLAPGTPQPDGPVQISIESVHP